MKWYVVNIKDTTSKANCLRHMQLGKLNLRATDVASRVASVSGTRAAMCVSLSSNLEANNPVWQAPHNDALSLPMTPTNLKEGLAGLS